MSADLFAEFAPTAGSGQQQQQQQQVLRTGQPDTQSAHDFSFFEGLSTAPPPPAQGVQTQQNPGSGNFSANQTSTNDDNDDWGDFEGGSSSFAPPAVKDDPFAFTPAPPPQTQTAWRNTSVPQQDAFAFDSNPAPQTSQWTKAPVVKAKKSNDPTLFWDMEDELNNADDDDFGDFEGQDSNANATAPQSSSSGIADLLGDLSVSQPQPPEASQGGGTSTSKKAFTSTTTKKEPVAGFGSVSRPKNPSVVPATTSPAKEIDTWDSFDDWEESIPTKTPTKKSSSQEVTQNAPSSTLDLRSPTFNDPSPGDLPPTNVPPPTVLLSLFPPLFAEAQEKLFKPMAAQTLPMRNKILAEPATIAYLQGYIELASVAARVISGRKQRWKRDQHLSQGMRIGPASSRATSGMKLTSIDKSEDKKEEREAADVVRAWKDQIGRLRHVVSAANQVKAGTLGKVPDLQETMAVRLLKQSEGGVPARMPCMLCGLKRDERVSTADSSVEDSFGEWWIEQVNMHRGCRNFWDQHKDKLRQH